MADYGNVVARCSAKRTSIANLLLDVAHNSTFGDGAKWKYVSNGERGVLAGVDELSGVHALVGDEGLGVQLVSVWVAENDTGERRTAASIVDDLLDHTTDVSMALSEIVGAKLGRSLVEALKRSVSMRTALQSGGMMLRTCVRGEDRAAALPLVANNTTHLDGGWMCLEVMFFKSEVKREGTRCVVLIRFLGFFGVRAHDVP